jgi:hypothetical protein
LNPIIINNFKNRPTHNKRTNKNHNVAIVAPIRAALAVGKSRKGYF